MDAAADDPRAALRAMWQLPSTWRVLRLLATPLGYPPPGPSAFEDALLDPVSHELVIANMHGRLVGLAAGASAQTRWIGHVARFVRSFPGTFGQILGHAPLAQDSSSGPPGDSQDGVHIVRDSADNGLSAVADEGGPEGPSLSDDESGTGSKLSTRGSKHPVVSDASREHGESDGGQSNLSFRALAIFKTVEEYAALSPHTRLLLLHAMAELVICEHDTLLLAGQLSTVDVEEMRLEPVGYDAVGSAYWYFGDEERLYREPDARAVRAAEARARADARAAEARAIAEARAAELKEQARRKREEAERRSVAREAARKASKQKWAPRVAAGRSTRASVAKEREMLALKPGEQDAVVENDDQEHGTRRRRRASRLRDCDSDVAVADARPSRADFESASHREEEDVSVQDRGSEVESSTKMERGSHFRERSGRGARGSRSSSQPSGLPEGEAYSLHESRTSGRKRQRTARMAESVQVNGGSKKRRRGSIAETFTDPELRSCSHWELVCSGPAELLSFVERFGSLESIKHAAELHLVRRLKEELYPVVKQAHDASVKEEERRLRAEWLLSNQKRSSRVSAMERKRQEEEEAAAARAEEEAALERARLQHEAFAQKQVSLLEKELSKDLRAARRRLACEKDDKTAPIQQNIAPTASLSRGERARRRQASQNGETSGLVSGVKTESLEYALGSSFSAAEKPQSLSPSPDFSSANISEDTNRPSDNAAASPDGRPHLIDDVRVSLTPGTNGVAVKSLGDGGEDRKAERGDDSVGCLGNGQTGGLGRRRLPSVVQEADIPEHMTWQFLAEDSMPTRAFTSFCFVNPLTLDTVSLEETERVEDEEGNRPLVVGYGVILPPPDSGAVPICIETEFVQEWVIEYGRDPRLWAKTEHAWYELRNPLHEYASLFSPVLRKYEICVRLSILGQSMRAESLTYENVVEMLSMRYLHMRAYKETDILTESGFIISQMDDLRKASITKSGFLKQLRKHEADVRRHVARERERDARAAQKAEIAKRRSQLREAEMERDSLHKSELAAQKACGGGDRKPRPMETTANTAGIVIHEVSQTPDNADSKCPKAVSGELTDLSAFGVAPSGALTSPAGQGQASVFERSPRASVRNATGAANSSRSPPGGASSAEHTRSGDHGSMPMSVHLHPGIIGAVEEPPLADSARAGASGVEGANAAVLERHCGDKELFGENVLMLRGCVSKAAAHVDSVPPGSDVHRLDVQSHGQDSEPALKVKPSNMSSDPRRVGVGDSMNKPAVVNGILEVGEPGADRKGELFLARPGSFPDIPSTACLKADSVSADPADVVLLSGRDAADKHSHSTPTGAARQPVQACATVQAALMVSEKIGASTDAPVRTSSDHAVKFDVDDGRRRESPAAIMNGYTARGHDEGNS